MAGTVTAPGKLSRDTRLALVAMGLGIFVVANDFTALTVAVVDIEEALDTTLNRAQWVINAYTVVFGVLIVTGGRLADLYGRKRVFLVGATIFGTFSLVGAVAPSIGVLIAARALMGVGGALIWPSVLGMTYAILPEERAGLAGGLVMGVAGLGNAMGPLVAGTLVDLASWRWVFVVNAPVALFAVLVTVRLVPESTAAERSGLDYRGIATLSAAVVLLLIGLDRGSDLGFGHPMVVGMVVTGVVLLAVFALVERGAGPSALVPRRVMQVRQFAVSFATVLLMSATLFGLLLYVPQFTQRDLGWSALEAGAGLLPLMLVFAVVSFAVGPLYDDLGPRLVVGGGAVCLAVGALWVGLTVGHGYVILVPGLVVAGSGIGLFFSGVTTAAVTAVSADDNSLAGGIIYMGNVAGGSVGLGVNTAIVLASSSFTDGIRNAFLADSVLSLTGAALAVAYISGGGRFHPRLLRHHRAHG